MRSCLNPCFEGARRLGVVVSLAWLCVPPGEAQRPPGGREGDQGTDCPAKLKAFDPASGDLYGCAVSLNEDLLVVGSLRDDDRGADSGSAYVFRKTGGAWTQPAKLLGSDTSAGDQFGFSVALSKPYVIVGAPFNGVNGSASGAAYIFRCGAAGCHQEARMTALGASAFDQFGFSVSIDETTAVVGAPGVDGTGAVEIYQRSGGVWARQARIRPGGAAPGSGFGFSVSIRGDTLVAGAPYNAAAGESAGAAYVFQETGTTWTERRLLIATDAAAQDLFGFSVAIGDGSAVVGAPGNGGGAAYVFSGSGAGWGSGQKLAASGVSGGDRYGVSVAINAGADRVLVGAQLGDGMGAEAGAAYVFRRSGGSWSQAAQLIDDRVGPGDELGLGAAIDDDAAVVGAFKDDEGGVDSGTAYAFFLDEDAQPVCGADLEVTKTGPPSVSAGRTVTYRVTVANAGPETGFDRRRQSVLLPGVRLSRFHPEPRCRPPGLGQGPAQYRRRTLGL